MLTGFFNVISRFVQCAHLLQALVHRRQLLLLLFVVLTFLEIHPTAAKRHAEPGPPPAEPEGHCQCTGNLTLDNTMPGQYGIGVEGVEQEGLIELCAK